jgi:hypothetical protein
MHAVPLKQNPDMLRLTPSQALTPGLYQFGSDAKVWVEQSEFLQTYRERANSELSSKRWKQALATAAFVLGVKPGDEEMEKVRESALAALLLEEGGQQFALSTWSNKSDGSVSNEAFWGAGQPVALSRDGSQVLVGALGAQSGAAQWDLRTRSEIRRVDGGRWITNVVYRQGRPELICGGGQVVKVWNAETGAQVQELQIGGDLVEMQEAVQGTQLVCMTRRVLELWDLDSGQRLRTLGGHPNAELSSMAVSPDGQMAALSYMRMPQGEPRIRLWDLSSGEEIRSFATQGRSLPRLSFNLDGKQLYIACADGIEAWSVDSGEVLKRGGALADIGSVRELLHLSDARHVVLVGPEGGRIAIHQSDNLSQFRNSSHGRHVNGAALSEDGKILALAEAGQVTVWQLPELCWSTPEAHAAVDASRADRLKEIPHLLAEWKHARDLRTATLEREFMSEFVIGKAYSGVIANNIFERKLEFQVRAMDETSRRLDVEVWMSEGGLFGQSKMMDPTDGAITFRGSSLELSFKDWVIRAVRAQQGDRLEGTWSRGGDSGPARLNLEALSMTTADRQKQLEAEKAAAEQARLADLQRREELLARERTERQEAADRKAEADRLEREARRAREKAESQARAAEQEAARRDRALAQESARRERAAAQEAAQQQSKGPLSLGNVAPPMFVSKWVNGSAVEVGPGHAALVVFWSLPPGRSDMRWVDTLLSKWHSQYAAQGVPIIAVTKGNPNEVETHVKSQGTRIKYLVAVDLDDKTFNAWFRAANQSGVPCAFLVNGAGRIVFLGHPETDNCEGAIKNMLNSK